LSSEVRAEEDSVGTRSSSEGMRGGGKASSSCHFVVVYYCSCHCLPLRPYLPVLTFFTGAGMLCSTGLLDLHRRSPAPLRRARFHTPVSSSRCACVCVCARECVILTIPLRQGQCVDPQDLLRIFKVFLFYTLFFLYLNTFHTRQILTNSFVRRERLHTPRGSGCS
jgi:hypothetical protein